MPLDLIFPKKCLGCGQTGSYFCSSCLNLVSLEPRRICPVCLKPSLDGLTHPRCRRPHGLDGLTAVFADKGVIRKAIRKLKYKFVTDLASNLVELFLSFCGEDRVFSNLCCQENLFLVPLPLHPSRKRWRGFNQAELLGKMISSNLDLVFEPKILRRKKKTQPQVGLSQKEFRQNLKGAFELNPDYSFPIADNRFILFDDLWMRGITLKEATKVLKRNRAKEVWGLTIAR